MKFTLLFYISAGSSWKKVQIVLSSFSQLYLLISGLCANKVAYKTQALDHPVANSSPSKYKICFQDLNNTYSLAFREVSLRGIFLQILIIIIS